MDMRNIKAPGPTRDCILSAELFGQYKPDPAACQGAARLPGIEAAAHKNDLHAARPAGCETD